MRGRFLSVIIVLLLLAGCSKEVGVVPVGGYPPDVSSIVQRNCAVAGCHNDQSNQVAGGINMETWESLFEGSRSGSPVIPYSSRFSSLMYFVNTYEDLGLINQPTMPLNRQPLTREEVLTLKRWIDAGAPDSRGNVKWAEPGRKKLYVVNQGCDVVTVMDAATGLPTRAVDVGISSAGDAPHSVHVSPDGEFWYVVFINANFMQKFRCSDDGYVGDIPLTPYAAGIPDISLNAVNWNSFVISNDGSRAYCTSLEGKIAVVDLERRKFVRWLGGQQSPHGIAINSANDKIYVTAQDGSFVTVLDTGLTSSKELYFDLSGERLDLHEIVFSPDERRVLVTCQRTNEVRIMNLQTGNVQAVQTGKFPQEIVYDGLTDAYYVTCVGDTSGAGHGVVTKINGTTFSATHLAVGYQPHGIAVNEVTKELYVASRNISEGGIPPHHGSICSGRNGFVNFVDLTTFTLKPGTFEVSVDPYFIAARP